MGSYKDLTGEQFGLLTVLGQAPRIKGDRQATKWLCECTCGNVVVIRRDKLTGGRSHCGCMKPKPEKRVEEPKEKRPRGRPRIENRPTPPKPPTPKMQPTKRTNPKPKPFITPKDNKIKAYGLTRQTKCKHCKKIFERPNGEWGYRIGNNYFCGYKCLRAEQKGT